MISVNLYTLEIALEIHSILRMQYKSFIMKPAFLFHFCWLFSEYI